MICIDEDSQPHCKVGDFGLAKVLANCNYDGQVLQYYLATECGTEYFMAPEVYDGHYTEKADVFSMGVIFQSLVPKLFWKQIGLKKYLLMYVVDGVDHVPVGKYMSQNNVNVAYLESVREQMSESVILLGNSMTKLRYSERPTAAEVNQSLKSISPKELSLLAQPPTASP